MANILDKIIADKRIEVLACKKAVPLEQIKEGISEMPKCRNFYKAVTKRHLRGLNVIAEVKKASPSAGLIRENFDPVEIATTYEAAGADAISVLTDEKYFQGRLDYLTAVKMAVDIPVLRKDFVIDEYQVFEARKAGADAILLIAEALEANELLDLMILASELSLSCLVEVHSLESLMKIMPIIEVPMKSYVVLGVNNRDLGTMTVDINNFSRISQFAEDRFAMVAESGIKTREDVEKLIKYHASAVLIGQTLCESEDISKAFKELFG